MFGLLKGKFKDKNNNGIDDRYYKIAKGRVARIDLDGSGGDPAAAAMDLLKNHPYVEYAQFNYLHYNTVMPDDPRFDEKWGPHNTGQTGGTPDADIDAPEAWEISTGSHNVVVGVIDGGFNYLHEDLAANAWFNPGEIANDGDPHEGNGH